MSVLIITNVGELKVKLFTEEAPMTCCNFLKLCKLKYYHWCVFHNVQRDFLAQTGDPTGSGRGGMRYQAVIDNQASPYFVREEGSGPRRRHAQMGLLSMAGVKADSRVLCGSQFFVTLTDLPLVSLDEQHRVFGEILLADGKDDDESRVNNIKTLKKINAVACDDQGRPLIDIYIQKTIVLEDPFPDSPNFPRINRSPPPTAAFRDQRRPEPVSEEIVSDARSEQEQRVKERREEAHSLAISLEMLGERRSAELKAPENALFVCRLNPLTEAEDLRTIFARFGPVTACEVARDRTTGTSLGYAFITFETKEAAEAAYLKMNTVVIDDRRIKVDFCHSVRQGMQRNAGGERVRSRGDRDRYRSEPDRERSDRDRGRDHDRDRRYRDADQQSDRDYDVRGRKEHRYYERRSHHRSRSR